MYCSKCGAKNNSGATFCHKCGTKIGKPLESKTGNKASILNAKTIGLIVIALVIIGILAVVFHNQFSQSSAEQAKAYACSQNKIYCNATVITNSSNITKTTSTPVSNNTKNQTKTLASKQPTPLICNPSAGFSCTNGAYNYSTSTITVTLSQDSGSNWNTAQVFYVNQSEESSVEAMGVNNNLPHIILQDGMPNGQSVNVNLTTKTPSVGYIWVSYTTSMSGASTTQVQVANIGTNITKATLNQNTTTGKSTTYGSLTLKYGVGQDTNIPNVSIYSISSQQVRFFESGTISSPYSIGQATNIPNVTVANISDNFVWLSEFGKFISSSSNLKSTTTTVKQSVLVSQIGTYYTNSDTGQSYFGGNLTGFVSSSGTYNQVSFSVHNTGTEPEYIDSFELTPLSFSLVGLTPTLPDYIPAGGTQIFTLNISSPNQAYSGSISLVINYHVISSYQIVNSSTATTTPQSSHGLSNGNFTFTFTLLNGTQDTWSFPITTYNDYVAAPRILPILHINVSGVEYDYSDYRGLVTPSFFANVTPTLTRGKNAQQFINEVVSIKNQLTVYSLVFSNESVYPAEVLGSGQGDCKDFGVLMASILEAGNLEANYGMQIQFWYVNSSTLGNEKPDHLILHITFANGTGEWVDTTNVLPQSSYLYIHGWAYNLTCTMNGCQTQTLCQGALCDGVNYYTSETHYNYCTTSGYVVGADDQCHLSCGSIYGYYCNSSLGYSCYNNECVSCPSGDYLATNGECYPYS